MTEKIDFATLLEDTSIAGPASQESIGEAENILGVRFPDQYAQFLSSCGAMMGNGYEIAGLFEAPDDEPPLWQNIVLVMEQLKRAGVYNHIPTEYIPISDDGMGITFYLNAAEGSSCGCVIAIGPGIDEKVISEDFVTFLRSLIVDGNNLT